MRLRWACAVLSPAGAVRPAGDTRLHRKSDTARRRDYFTTAGRPVPGKETQGGESRWRATGSSHAGVGLGSFVPAAIAVKVARSPDQLGVRSAQPTFTIVRAAARLVDNAASTDVGTRRLQRGPCQRQASAGHPELPSRSRLLWPSLRPDAPKKR